MKNNSKIIVSGVALLGAILLVIFTSSNLLQKETNQSDSLRFKEEYESLNGTIRESDGALYNSVSVLDSNPIQYIDAKEAVEILKSETAILYIGANWCPWCRTAVPVLFDVARDRNVQKIYYLNLDEEKSEYKIQDGEMIQTKKGSDGYYELLDFLGSKLDDYVLTDSNQKKYSTGEKRIYMPFVIAAKDGSVLKTHVGTVSLNSDQTKYSTMTEEQTKKLYDIYDQLFDSIFGKNDCSDGTSCN